MLKPAVKTLMIKYKAIIIQSELSIIVVNMMFNLMNKYVSYEIFLPHLAHLDIGAIISFKFAHVAGLCFP